MGALLSGENVSNHVPQPGTNLRNNPKHDVLVYPFMQSRGPDNTQFSVLTDPLDKYLTEQELWETFKRWHLNPLPTSPYLVGMDVSTEDPCEPQPVPETSRLTPRSEDRMTPRTPRDIREARRRMEYMGEGPADATYSTVGVDYPYWSIVCKRYFSRHKLFKEGLTPKLLAQNPVRILRTWFSEEHKLMIRMCCGADGKTQVRFREFVKFHSDPFILEIWRMQKGGGRGANKHVTDFWEAVVDHAIESDRSTPPVGFEETHDFKHWIGEAVAPKALW